MNDQGYEEWDKLSVLAAEMRDALEENVAGVYALAYPAARKQALELLSSIDRKNGGSS